MRIRAIGHRFHSDRVVWSRRPTTSGTGKGGEKLFSSICSATFSLSLLHGSAHIILVQLVDGTRSSVVTACAV
jgi:hypothetical protein